MAESDEPPWKEDEYWTMGLLRLARKLCALPQVTPSQLIGLAHVIHALDQLPNITTGVSVEVSLGLHDESEGKWHAQAAIFHVSECCLRCDCYSGGGDGRSPSEDSSITKFEETTRSDRFALVFSPEEYCELVDWFENAEDLLEIAGTSRFRLNVWDESSPNCIPPARKN